MQRYAARLRAVTPLAPAVNEYVFALEEPGEMAFRAGQFVMLGIDADGPTRPYSLVNAEEERDIARLCVKILPEGAVSAKLARARVGDPMHINGPFGAFTLKPAPTDGPRVFIATGTGIAPFLSMLRTHLPNDPAPARLYFGNRTEEEILYRAELTELARAYPQLTVRFVLSKPPASWEGATGRVTGMVDEIAAPGAHYYLCGNPNMIEEIRGALAGRGVAPSDIFSEKFTLIGAKKR